MICRPFRRAPVVPGLSTLQQAAQESTLGFFNPSAFAIVAVIDYRLARRCEARLPILPVVRHCPACGICSEISRIVIRTVREPVSCGIKRSADLGRQTNRQNRAARRNGSVAKRVGAVVVSLRPVAAFGSRQQPIERIVIIDLTQGLR